MLLDFLPLNLKQKLSIDLEKIASPEQTLVFTRQLRSVLDDTLALAELYARDSREFPFDDVAFSGLGEDIMNLQISYLSICAMYAELARPSQYDDIYVVLRQLVDAISLIKPLEPTRTSWVLAQQTLTKLYFLLTVLINLPQPLAESDSGYIVALQGGYIRKYINDGEAKSIDEILQMVMMENDTELWDDVKGLRFGHSGETLLMYIARTRPLSQALAQIDTIVSKGTDRSIGLNVQTLHAQSPYPKGTTLLHILARRYKQTQSSLQNFLESVMFLQKAGADVRIEDDEGRTFMSILLPPNVAYSPLSLPLFGGLVGGATAGERGQAAYLREKYDLSARKASNIARILLNSIVHHNTSAPFDDPILITEEWVMAWSGPYLPSNSPMHAFSQRENRNPIIGRDPGSDRHFNNFDQIFGALGQWRTSQNTIAVPLSVLLDERNYRSGGIFTSVRRANWQADIYDLQEDAEVVERREVLVPPPGLFRVEPLPRLLPPEPAVSLEEIEREVLQRQREEREEAELLAQVALIHQQEQEAAAQKQQLEARAVQSVQTAAAEIPELRRELEELAQRLGVDPDRITRLDRTHFRPVPNRRGFNNVLRIGGVRFMFEDGVYKVFNIDNEWSPSLTTRERKILEDNGFA